MLDPHEESFSSFEENKMLHLYEESLSPFEEIKNVGSLRGILATLWGDQKHWILTKEPLFSPSSIKINTKLMEKICVASGDNIDERPK